MRDGSTEGMQCFDGELERLVRTGMIDLQMALAYASNAGNLRLQLADFAEAPVPPRAVPPEESNAGPELLQAPLDEVEVKR